MHFMFYLFHLFAIKNPAFREEREWRIISYLFKSAGNDPKKLQLMKFRAQSDRIIPYLAVDLEHLDVPSIIEVIVGPRNITPTSVIERVLRARGWEDVPVRRSEATYR